jgi:hypothetical protein
MRVNGHVAGRLPPTSAVMSIGSVELKPVSSLNRKYVATGCGNGEKVWASFKKSQKRDLPPHGGADEFFASLDRLDARLWL